MPRDAIEKLRELIAAVTPTVEFYLKREIESPANHQEFAREAQQKLDRWRELEALLPALEQRERELRELIIHAWIHSGYLDCGFEQMTTGQKGMYNEIIGRATLGPEGEKR